MADVREAHLRKLLDDIAKQHNYITPEVRVTALPPTGANFTSQLFHIVISAPDREDLKLFAKVAVVGEAFRAQAPTKIFDIERHVSTKLAKVFADIEEKHRVPEKHRLFMPKYYGSSDVYLEEVLVLQDLSAEGFTTYDRLKSVDFVYASKAVEELAKLHALSIAYQKEFPEDYEEAKNVLKREMFEDTPMLMATIKHMVQNAVEGVREENRGKVLKLMDKEINLDTFYKYYRPLSREVLVHSDFRQSNLMHKVHADGSLDMVIIDYQTVHPGSAANDLLFFIFTSSDGQFRRQHYRQLIDHYYAHMAEALRRLSLSPEEVFPREDFDQDLKHMLPFGLIVATMMLPMITMDATHAESESRCVEDLAATLMNTNQLCADRLNEVVDDYIAWGVL